MFDGSVCNIDSEGFVSMIRLMTHWCYHEILIDDESNDDVINKFIREKKERFLCWFIFC